MAVQLGAGADERRSGARGSAPRTLDAPVLNLADLGAILIILINPITGAVCSATGSSLEMLAATAVGLLVGITAAWCSSKLSYWLLGRGGDARGLIAGLTLMGYLLTPMLFLGGSMLASLWLARCILSIAV